MPTFFFSYRGNEISTAVNADTHEQALRKLESGVDTLFVVNTESLHGDMWTSTDANGYPIDPDKRTYHWGDGETDEHYEHYVQDVDTVLSLEKQEIGFAELVEFNL